MRLIEDIAEMQVTRGEFFKLIGIALLSAFGIARLLDSISEQAHIFNHPLASKRASTRTGFGSGRFGS